MSFIILWSNFQVSVESNARLLGFCFNLSYDWPETQAIQLIRNKTKTDRDLVIRVFPRFSLLSWFYFEFSLANKEVNHRFDCTL